MAALHSNEVKEGGQIRVAWFWTMNPLCRSLVTELKVCTKLRREITALRGVVASADPKKILKRVARRYGVTRQRLLGLGERGLQAKNVAMWRSWESGTKSLREIGEL